MTADNLTPGVYTMTGHGSGIVSFNGALEVVAGATSPVRLQLVPGSLCRVDVWFPEGAQPERYACRFVSAAGKVGGEYEGTIGGHSLRPLTVSRHLPRGTWRLQFTSGDLAGEVEFEVSGGGDEVTARIDLG